MSINRKEEVVKVGYFTARLTTSICEHLKYDSLILKTYFTPL